ncbi:MAG: FtsW/RodA/SpoVE family cell cycle protein, partial [Bacteroidetes bacterium]|nr:FtsW/RodA/SpoVE family cell cycle protein [Bacteroidota bacterium]
MLDRTDRSLVGVWWWTVDRWILAAAILLMVIGTLLVMAAGPAVATLINLPSQHFVIRQAMYLVPAVGIMLATSLLEPRAIRILALVGLIGAVGLMVTTILAGSEIKGATRWISIAGISLQPSEFAKPLFAVVSAWLLTLWREGQDFPGWIYSSALMAAIVGILVLQPDIGMTLMMVMTWGFQMFLAGLPMLLVISVVALVPLGLIVAYLFLGHVESRINQFFEGGAWQVKQAKDAFANGGMLGVGPGDGTVKLHLPDAHSDFIFAVAAEEYGALACLSLLALYGFIVLRGFIRAISDEGLFCLIAASSLLMQFGVQASIHMASSVDLIPTKGMTLPLIS